MQFSRPENASLVREALIKAGREDLIGNGPGCLVRGEFRRGERKEVKLDKKTGKVKKPTSRMAENGKNNRPSRPEGKKRTNSNKNNNRTPDKMHKNVKKGNKRR